MKLKIKKLEQSMMSYSGNNVLQSIMDTSTPGVDLLVREAVQNSTDAILDYNSGIAGNIDFSIVSFDADSFLNIIEDDISTNNLRKIYNGEQCDCLIISDSNTTGLLGDYKYNSKGHNNFYNLVYDMGNGKDVSGSGGSWGYGKSVYYRFGEGIVFYYTKTMEASENREKLAGALIVDEKDDDCILGKDSRGIAFYGDIEDDNTKPLFNHDDIASVLEIFGIEPYQNKTGTIVMIPFIKEETLIPAEYGSISIERGIRDAIQKWYFPRLNNSLFDGHSFVASVNKKSVSLNKFYQKLQDLYNGLDSNHKELPIKINKVDSLLGTLFYRSFSREELGVFTPPYNIDDPFNFLLLENDKEGYNKGIVCYTRKPGMIVNYDSNKFGNNYVDSDHYLFAIFKLNDSASCGIETVGEYFKGTEKANHMEWVDSKVKNCPQFSEIKPFSKLYNKIKKHLGSEFALSEEIPKEQVDNGKKIQKMLGKLLLPKEDFGSENNGGIPSGGGTGNGGGGGVKRKIGEYSFDGFSEGLLQYSFVLNIPAQKKSVVEYKVNADGTKINIDKWEEMGFYSPFAIHKLDLNQYVWKDASTDLKTIIVGEQNIAKSYKIRDLILLSPIKSKVNIVSGFKFTNQSDEKIVISFKVFVKPIDITYSVDVAIRQE